MGSIIQYIKYVYNAVFILLLCLSTGSCTEQYVFQTTTTFESIPVVQANITNEVKKQEVKITRSYRLEEDGATAEEGATVYIIDSDNTNYGFEFDTFRGVYVSENDFRAVPEKTYQLNIITKDGKSYSSTKETLTAVNEIEVEPKIEIIDGNKGVQIVVSSYDPDSKSKFYRYEYEETYKVVSPEWSPDKLIVDPNSSDIEHPDFLVVPRANMETRVCYGSKKSDDLTLISTVGLSEDRINLPIRFIDITDPIIRERYSIIVRQYVQNLESYTYYKTLKNLSTSTSILSQVQPGFNYGNLKSNSNSEDKIIGYFEVSSVSSQRIFFNFRDIFKVELFPPFFIKCNFIELINCYYIGCNGYKILSYINGSGKFEIYYAAVPSDNKFIYVSAACGDCTNIASNIKPLFWID